MGNWEEKKEKMQIFIKVFNKIIVNLDSSVDEILCGNNHVIALNYSLKKIMMWGNNENGQIDIFKKNKFYSEPKIIFLDRNVENFKVIAKGDYSGILMDRSIDHKDLEMEMQNKEDIFEIINSLSRNIN